MVKKTTKKAAASYTQQRTEFFECSLKANQKTVSNFLRENSISILKGMAGTGKDFIQMYRALDGLNKKEFTNLVISKPIVEVGLKMGFLPGDIDSKITPYEKSFHDNITKMIGRENYNAMKHKISFEPVNFMRGNTFPEFSVIILSEAQNLTLHELISFVTRLPESSKLFINCDPFQKDIKNSGIEKFLTIMEGIEGVGIIELGDDYQMRNPMIIEITRRYYAMLNN